MKRDDIKRWQAKKLAKSLWPSLNYLCRLRSRMEKASFLPDDPYFKLVEAAYNSVHTLWVHTHYLSCKGVGRSSSEDGDEEPKGGPGQVDKEKGGLKEGHSEAE